jgi:hypothetical protein
MCRLRDTGRRRFFFPGLSSGARSPATLDGPDACATRKVTHAILCSNGNSLSPLLYQLWRYSRSRQRTGAWRRSYLQRSRGVPGRDHQGSRRGPVVIRVLGGTVGDTTMSVSDGPALPEGGRVVVFLKRDAGNYVVTGRSTRAIDGASPEASAASESAFAGRQRQRLPVGSRLLLEGRGAPLPGMRAVCDHITSHYGTKQ